MQGRENLFCVPVLFHFSEKMHFSEFAVTETIDWCDVKTVYVKAASSSDAIRFMLKLTCPSNPDRPFVDFKFRTAIPECCIESDAVIYSEQ